MKTKEDIIKNLVEKIEILQDNYKKLKKESLIYREEARVLKHKLN